MRSTVEALEGNKVKLSVEVDEAEFEKAVEAAFKKIAQEVRIPGFRPGKVPRRVLEARIGAAAARQEAIRDALPDYYVQALRETDTDAIAQPEIEITGGEESGVVAFDAVVEIRPTVALEGYGGIRVEVPSPIVTDEDLDKQVDRLRGQQAELVEADRPAQDGDVLVIDLKATQVHDDHEDVLDDETDYSYEIGSGSGLPPEVDEHLIGGSVGDVADFDATAGERTIHITTTIHKISEKVLPEITDEWAGEASEFDTVAELRTDLRTRMETSRRVQTIMAIRDKAIDGLVDLVEEEPPSALIDTEVQRRLQDLDARLRQQGADLSAYLQATGQGAEEVLADLRTQSLPAVKADLALRALAELEELYAGEDDLDAEVERIAQQVGRKAAQVRRDIERNDQVHALRSDVRKAKALEWLIEHVEIVDTEGNAVDRSILEPPAAPEDSQLEDSQLEDSQSEESDEEHA